MGHDRQSILNTLLGAKPELHERFGVSSILLFGSFAREDAGPQSDVDLIVDFDRPIGLFELAELHEHLSALLGRVVDVGTVGGLRPDVRARVLQEALRVA